jgi:hypothetical protein
MLIHRTRALVNFDRHPQEVSLSIHLLTDFKMYDKSRLRFLFDIFHILALVSSNLIG